MNYDTQKRLLLIRIKLIKGDIKYIAEKAGVHRVWVSQVLHGHRRSERILRIAEELVSERETNEEQKEAELAAWLELTRENNH